MKRLLVFSVLLLCSAAVLAACGRPPVTLPPPLPPTPPIYEEEGIASWYGLPYHGRRTASGEVYNMYGVSAAHRILPFGTKVLVLNRDNGKEVVVPVNDRGPFIEGRVIDLSLGAARLIDMERAGLARVKLRVVGGADRHLLLAGPFTVQVGAFAVQENALSLQKRLEGRYGRVWVEAWERPDGRFYRVRVGKVTGQEQVQELARRLRAEGLPTFVVRVD